MEEIGKFSSEVPTLKRYTFCEKNLLVLKMLISRTGYTGEDGAELFCPADRAAELWQALMTAGVSPCGLGCRDTLRMEAAMPLYGHELDRTVTPVEAGLTFAINREGGFIGAERPRACGLGILAVGHVPRDQSLLAHGIIGHQEPGLVDERAHASEIPIINEQIVALGDNQRGRAVHGDRVRDGLFDLAQEARGIDNVIALIAKTLEECDVTGGIEGIGCALAITPTEIE
jgi:hypothetical protein